MKNTISKLAAVTVALLVAQPAVSMTTTDLYNKYQKQNNHKAFAISLNGIAGASWGADSRESAISIAIETCKNSGGKQCSITEVDGSPWSSSSATDSNSAKTINNYNIISNGVSYTPQLDVEASGFFINKSYLITTSDLVEKCTKVSFERNGKLIDTTVVRADKVNGIAILKSAAINGVWPNISPQRKTNQGNRTYAYGYDLSDLVNSQVPAYQGKITDGIISLASGSYNDIRFMSITNALTPGNVGGPVISENGTVMGLVTNMSKQVIKSSLIRIFLDEQSIDYVSNSTNPQKSVSPSSIAQNAQQFVVPMVCLNKQG